MRQVRWLLSKPLLVAVCGFAVVACNTRVSSAQSGNKRKRVTHTYELNTAKTGKFLRWKLGWVFIPWAGRLFSNKHEMRSVYRFADRVRFAGRIMDRVKFHTSAWPNANKKQRRLDEVVLTISVDGKPDKARKLAKWMDRLCSRYTKRVRRYMPSPMVHPKYGAAFLSRGRCGGVSRGLRVRISEEQSWSSRSADRSSTITIVLSAAKKKP